MPVLEEKELLDAAATIKHLKVHTLRSTKVLDFFRGYKLAGGGTVFSLVLCVDGYEHLHLFVDFDHGTPRSPGVQVWADFGFETGNPRNGLRADMFTHNYVNLEPNGPTRQMAHPLQVAGQHSLLADGNQKEEGHYVVRIPVMGPFVRVGVQNLDLERESIINVCGYLVS
jgi:hypothetical protein